MSKPVVRSLAVLEHPDQFTDAWTVELAEPLAPSRWYWLMDRSICPGARFIAPLYVRAEDTVKLSSDHRKWFNRDMLNGLVLIALPLLALS